MQAPTCAWDSTFARDVSALAKLVEQKSAQEARDQAFRKLGEQALVYATFLYDSGVDLLAGSRALLQFWVLLLGALPTAKDRNKLEFLRMIKAIVLRKEFDLALLKKPDGPDPKAHRSIFLRYRDLLLESADVAVRYFISKPLSRAERAFCLETMAIAFFRVPTICGFLLDSAVPQDQKASKTQPPPAADAGAADAGAGAAVGASGGIGQQVEGKNITPAESKEKGQVADSSAAQQLSEDDTVRIKAEIKKVLSDFSEFKRKSGAENRKYTLFFDKNPSLFEWTLWLHGADDTKLQGSVQLLKHTLARARNFFPFVSCIVCHVCKFATGNVRFGLVPGYWTLVRSVLKRVADKTALQYTVPMVQCVSDLLQNRGLLGFFARLLLNRTDAFNLRAVDRCLNCLDEWFLVCAPNMSDPLPESMCYEKLVEALGVLLRSTNVQVLLKALAFVYSHAGRFYGKWRLKLADLILGDNFSNLFLHWCPEVRVLVQRILMFRLNRAGLLARGASGGGKSPKDDLGAALSRVLDRVSPTDTLSADKSTATAESGESKSPSGTTELGGAEIEPTLTHCACVYTPLTRAQELLDAELLEKLEAKVGAIEKCLAESGSEPVSDAKGSGPASAPEDGVADDQRVYTRPALFELRKCAKNFLKLQGAVKDLERGEVITPELYYDMLIT